MPSFKPNASDATSHAFDFGPWMLRPGRVDRIQNTSPAAITAGSFLPERPVRSKKGAFTSPRLSIDSAAEYASDARRRPRPRLLSEPVETTERLASEQGAARLYSPWPGVSVRPRGPLPSSVRPFRMSSSPASIASRPSPLRTCSAISTSPSVRAMGVGLYPISPYADSLSCRRESRKCLKPET